MAIFLKPSIGFSRTSQETGQRKSLSLLTRIHTCHAI